MFLTNVVNNREKSGILFDNFMPPETIIFQNMNKNIVTVMAAVLLSGITAFAIVKASVPDQAATTVVSSDGTTYRTVNLSASDYPDFTYAAENAVDAVVFVKVTVKTQQQYIDPFGYFFGYGSPQTRERVQQGSGSGVIIRQDGYIVTNNHVVQGATDVEVTLNNNKTYKAEIIGTDPATDVALIKVDASGLPAIEFADSDKLRLGEWVLAIGSPLGEALRSTITAGIVSAKGRQMPEQRQPGEIKIESFIQTDAAVNPGNSGGALVNKAGQLVGINTMIVSTTQAYSGYSFAVPSNIVKKIVGDLIDFGSVKRVVLGIMGGTVNGEIASKLKLSEVSGVYISEVSKGSAADKAGLRKEDVIVAIDSTKTVSMSELQEKVNGYRPGDKAVITYIRDGKINRAGVTFEGTVDSAGVADDEGTVAFYGARLKAADKGVEIVSAGNGKVASAGGENGYIILYVNDQKVSKPQDVIDIAKKSKRSVFIEGVTATGRPFYFGFGKDE